MNIVPSLLHFADGRVVDTQENWVKRREELLDILRREEYGYAPEKCAVTAEITERNPKCAAGSAVLETVMLSFHAPKGDHSVPMHFFVPNDGKKHPLILFINFRPEAYDMYCPTEEILDNGFALAVICYKSITSDDADFTNGLAGCFDRPTDGTGWGKISLWAYALHRAIDYLQTREEVDANNIAVAGHSRLGKTAMWCTAQDERIRFALINGSGCGGTALEQTKHADAETYEHIHEHFHYWFCENHHKYETATVSKVLDQHFALACIAPRFASVGCGKDDLWADPWSEKICCCAAAPAWEMYGLTGFDSDDSPASVGTFCHGGHIAYHLRDGVHFFSRRDWLHYMEHIKNNLA